MSNRPFLITLFADASYDRGAGGWHYWFKSEKGQGEGTNAGRALDPCHAELCGIREGVVAARKVYPEEKADWVIQCDSIHALGVILALCGAKVAKTSNMQFGPMRKFKPECVVTCQDIKAACGTGNIWLKHVKGHSSTQDVRHSLNRMNDRKARDARIAFSRALALAFAKDAPLSEEPRHE